MSDDQHNKEVHAVRALKKAVGRYAEHLREAISQARREIGAASSKAQEAVEDRRRELQRCEQGLLAAQRALAGCHENCGGLQQQQHVAAQRHAEAKLALERARKASQILTSAQSDMLKVLQTVEAKVGEHSSIASSALADLDAKLVSLSAFDLGRTVQNILGGVLAATETSTSAIDLGRVGGNALAAANIITPVRDHSISEMVEHRDEAAQHYVIHQDFETRKRMNSDEGRESTA
jgi:hypothetical protein